MVKNRFYKYLAMSGVLFLIWGCANSAGRLKPSPANLIWPPPPETPRIQFVSSVSTPRDFGIRKSMFRKFFDYVVGKKPSTMVSPYGINVDKRGRIYVVDTYLKTVHVFDVQGNGYYQFPKEPGSLGFPIDLSIDNDTGLIYITDSHAKAVKIYTDGGKSFVGLLGQGDLERPTGIAVNEITSELLVVDTLSANIVRYALDSREMKGFIGLPGTQPGHFHFPTNIFTASDGRFVISDTLNFRVQVFSPLGMPIKVFGRRGNLPGSFARPRGVAVDSDGNIYVVDALFDVVQIFDSAGRLLMDFGGPGSNAGKFWLPTGIYIDKNDVIYVSDTYNNRVQVFKYLKQGEAPK